METVAAKCASPLAANCTVRIMCYEERKKERGIVILAFGAKFGYGIGVSIDTQWDVGIE